MEFARRDAKWAITILHALRRVALDVLLVRAALSLNVTSPPVPVRMAV